MRLKDIASEVGVSVSTVSRVLNGKGNSAASLEVQKKIFEIAQKVGYKPNEFAQKLQHCNATVNSYSKTIACIFCRTSLKDSFFLQLSRNITDEATKKNWMIKYNLSTVETDTTTILNILSESHIDGIIILGRYEPEFVENLMKITTNIVYIGLNPVIKEGEKRIKFDHVSCDGYGVGVEAVEYLNALGHEKIGYIGETKNEIRFKAYKETLNKLNLPFMEDYVVDEVLSVQGGFEGMEKLLSKNPDISAVFCANDSTALGATRACREAGLVVPDDISLIGTDDLEISEYISPSLTTIHIPIVELGKMGITILSSRIDKQHVNAVQVSFPFEVIERESCKKR